MRFETLCLVREIEKKRCAFCMYKFAAAFADGKCYSRIMPQNFHFLLSPFVMDIFANSDISLFSAYKMSIFITKDQ